VWEMGGGGREREEVEGEGLWGGRDRKGAKWRRGEKGERGVSWRERGGGVGEMGGGGEGRKRVTILGIGGKAQESQQITHDIKASPYRGE